jgi:hypothetical protein
MTQTIVPQFHRGCIVTSFTFTTHIRRRERRHDGVEVGVGSPRGGRGLLAASLSPGPTRSFPRFDHENGDSNLRDIPIVHGVSRYVAAHPRPIDDDECFTLRQLQASPHTKGFNMLKPIGLYISFAGHGVRHGCTGRVCVRPQRQHGTVQVCAHAHGHVPRLLRRRGVRGLRGRKPRRRARHLRLRRRRRLQLPRRRHCHQTSQIDTSMATDLAFQFCNIFAEAPTKCSTKCLHLAVNTDLMGRYCCNNAGEKFGWVVVPALCAVQSLLLRRWRSLVAQGVVP